MTESKQATKTKPKLYLITADTGKPLMTLLLAVAFMALLGNSPSATAANSNNTTARCEQLQLQLRQLRDQYRRGYSIKQQFKMQQQQQRLELRLQQACQTHSPTSHSSNSGAATSSASERVSPAKTGARTTDNHQGAVVDKNSADNVSHNRNNTTSRQNNGWQVSSVAVKAPYQGAQQLAWLAYYQSPFYCYNVRATDKIRQCVELRQQAQQRFEHWWRQQSLSDQ